MNPLHVALNEYAVTEKTGAVHERRVLQYFHELGHTWVRDDETAWCSAFAGWVCKTAGVAYSNKLNARSWLDIGTNTTSPTLGDVVVLWRGSPSSWQGHVGFLIRKTDNYVYLLGGNQSDMVNISKYPISRVLGYRQVYTEPQGNVSITSFPSSEFIPELLRRLRLKLL